MTNLDGKIALVTGASYGIGKGVADELADRGATVYATGRTIDEAPRGGLVPCRSDHSRDEHVEALFDKIRTEQDRLDILVNSVWGGYENMIEDGQFTWPWPFWNQPFRRWDSMFTAGVRATYVSSAYAARMMVAQGRGLIVNISFWAAQKYLSNVAYGVSKAATDKLTFDMAHELRPHNVTVVSLYPGMVRTEKVMQAAAYLDLSNSESPRFIGRAVAALAADENVMAKSGRVLVAAALAEEYGFSDIDGKQPRPLTLDQV